MKAFLGMQAGVGMGPEPDLRGAVPGFHGHQGHVDYERKRVIRMIEIRVRVNRLILRRTI